MGTTRDLISDCGVYGTFEYTLESLFGERVRTEKNFGIALWSALVNLKWQHKEHGQVTYSFRAAGDLVAALRKEGDYMDWYCSGPEAIVSDEIGEAMLSCGWTWKKY